MVQIIEEGARRPRFLDQLLGGVQQATPKLLEGLMGQRQRAMENEQIKNLIGHDVSGIRDPDIRKEIIKNSLVGHAKNAPKIGQLQSGLKTIQRMREINKQGGLGRGSALTAQFSDTVNKRRGEYEQLGKSLISLASTIPIRNKAEFETLAENLYDPSVPDAKREGILDAMERIIEQGLQEHGSIQKNTQQKRRSLEEIFE